MSERRRCLAGDALLDIFVKDGKVIPLASLSLNPNRGSATRTSTLGENIMDPWIGTHTQPAMPNGNSHNPTGSNTHGITGLMNAMDLSTNKDTCNESATQDSNSENPTESSASALMMMPLDLLLEIIDHLPLSSIVALSLTNKKLRAAIGTHLCEELRKPGNEAQLWEFLTLLDKELPDHRACHVCETMHLRSPTDTSSDYLYVPIRQRDNCTVKSGEVILAPSIIFSFEEVQLVMRSHRFSSPEYGLPLDTLVRSHQSGSAGLPVKHITVKPRISKKEELIIERKETVTMPTAGVSDHRFENNQVIARVPFDFSAINLAPCKHRDRILSQEITVATKIMCRLYHRNSLHDEPTPCRICGPLRQRCGACETEWEIDPKLTWQGETTTFVSIITWRNLGECKTPYDRKWQRHWRSTRWSWAVTQREREEADGPLLEYCRTPDLSPREDFEESMENDAREAKRYQKRYL